jgi:hypothetical protein
MRNFHWVNMITNPKAVATTKMPYSGRSIHANRIGNMDKIAMPTALKNIPTIKVMGL